MIRIGVIADAHANLPATVAVLDALDAAGCSTIVHVGDAIGIGPHPGEVLTLLVERHVVCVMGNHDRWFAVGLPSPRPAWMSMGEADHHRWTHAQLTSEQHQEVRAWRYELDLQLGTTTIAFLHYTRSDDGEFEHVADSTATALDRLFASVDADVVVFGHDHRPYDLASHGRRFLSPGSLGCHDRAEARALVLAETAGGSVAADALAVGYDDEALLADLDRREVPEREFIRRAFLPRP